MSKPWQQWLRGGVLAICVGVVMQAVQFHDGAGVAAAQDDALAQARSAMEAGKSNVAYQLLKPMEADRAGEPAFDYLLGIAALDSGRYTEAVFALERVLAVEPGNALARAEIARAYLRLGERDTAQRELEAVQSRGDVPDEAKSAIERYLAAFRDTAGDALSWRAYIALTLGYDSNVNSATSDDTIGILGQAFNLAPGAQDQSDLFGTLAGGVSFVQPWSGSTSVLAGVSGDRRINQDQRRFDQDNFNAYGGVSFRHGKWTYTGVLQYGLFALNRDAFRNAFGATVQARRPLDEASEITGYGQVARLSYPTQSIRNAYRYTAGAGYSRSLGGPREGIVYAGAFAALEDENNDTVPHLGHIGLGANLGAEATLFPDARAYASASYEYRKYGGTEPLFLKKRHDDRVRLSVGVNYEVAKDWTISPNASFTRNWSNIPINDYDRAVFEVTVRRNFGN